MTTSAFSQTIYPRKIVIENDTIVCVTPAQLKTVVLDLNTGEYLQVENDLLKRQISKSDSLCVYWQKISEAKDTLIVMEVQKYQNLDRINQNLEASLNIEKRKSRNTIIGVGVGGTLVGILLGLLLSK